jgi:hypothetical protein
MVVRARLTTTLSGLLLAGSAGAGDLIDHNGFEACWSKAITSSTFYGSMQSAIEGATICVAQSGGSCGVGCTYNACYTAACPAAATGCPVVLHSDAFTGTLASGIFGANGSTSNIDVPVNINNGAIVCTVTASNVTLSYALGYTMQADGNNGLYSASLDQTLMTVNAGYSLGSANATCQSLAQFLAPGFVQQIQTAGAQLLLTLEQPATVGESVCPLQ